MLVTIAGISSCETHPPPQQTYHRNCPARCNRRTAGAVATAAEGMGHNHQHIKHLQQITTQTVNPLVQPEPRSGRSAGGGIGLDLPVAMANDGRAGVGGGGGEAGIDQLQAADVSAVQPVGWEGAVPLVAMHASPEGG